MNDAVNLYRRNALRKLVAGIACGVCIQRQIHADTTLISEDDPAASALHYVEDASRAKEAKAGNTCMNCSFYAGDDHSVQGACAALNNKQVKAAGWCSAWANM